MQSDRAFIYLSSNILFMVSLPSLSTIFLAVASPIGKISLDKKSIISSSSVGNINSYESTRN